MPLYEPEREEFQELRDSATGRRCFIIGTGKSLLDVDLSLIEGECTFGVNGLVSYKGLPFSPMFYCMMDPIAFERWQDKVEQVPTLRIAGIRDGQTLDEWITVEQRQDRAIEEGWFPGLESQFTWCSGCTNVVWGLVVPLAYWLGFQTVYLLGVDGGRFGHCYDDVEVDYSVANRMVTPEIIAKTREVFEKDGRKIINLNPETEGLPTATLQEVV